MLLGEVRCGTTTLASLLRSELGMQGPFTPWRVPLANEKESFYFAGHYFGCVAPRLYRVCFPLRLTHTLNGLVRRMLGLRPALLFDGCASHLSAPWAPRLLQRLQHEEMGGRPIVFVVCVREPVSQHLSWWRLEQGSMAFAESLGLGREYHKPPMRHAYPPMTLDEAWRLSSSPNVAHMWAEAESLVGSDWRLPDWAAPFPNGQLSAFRRFGAYAESLKRWHEAFGRSACVVVHQDDISQRPQAVLERIAAKCTEVLAQTPRRGHAKPNGSHGEAQPITAPRLNASLPLPGHLEPDDACLRRLGAYYRPLNEQLFQLLGEDLGWHSDPRYWWYRPAPAE